MSKFKNLKQGEVLSEAQFYTVNKVVGDKVELQPDGGESIVVNSKYVDSFLISGEQTEKEEKITRTDLAAMFISNPNIALSASFNKQVKPADVEKEIIEAYENSTPTNFKTAVKAAVKKGQNGEERVITGRHSGSVDEFGRVHFVDMKLKKEAGKDYDTRQRLVDPRTLNWMILRGTKYIAK